MGCPKHVVNCPDRVVKKGVKPLSTQPAAPTTTVINGVTYIVTPKDVKKA